MNGLRMNKTTFQLKTRRPSILYLLAYRRGEKETLIKGEEEQKRRGKEERKRGEKEKRARKKGVKRRRR